VFILFVAFGVIKGQDNVNTAIFIIPSESCLSCTSSRYTKQHIGLTLKKIKARQPAPPQRHWNPHKIVIKFRLESPFAFASSCLDLKIDYVIYPSENSVITYLSAQRNISEDLSTSLLELKISQDTRWYNNSLFNMYQRYFFIRRSVFATAEGYLGCVLHFLALNLIFLEKLWHKLPLIVVLHSIRQVPEHVLIIKPTRCTNSSNLFLE